MSSKTKIGWLSKPEDHDYPAALSYLSLIYGEKTAAPREKIATISDVGI
jgi:hypothetical protein